MAASATRSHTLPAILGVVGDIFGGILHAMTQVSEANGKVRRIQALSMLNDDELANRGLQREDIIRHVMGEAI